MKIGKAYSIFFLILILVVVSACGPTATEAPVEEAPAEEAAPVEEEQAEEAPPVQEEGETASVEEPTLEPTEIVVELPTEIPSAPFGLTSPAFAQGETIPTQYTCDGEDISPPLLIGDTPEGAQAYVLIMDDPDAPGGTWVHWVLYNIPAETRELAEAQLPDAALEGGIAQGSNSWEATSYGGPCPPSGEHRYFFKLYALDAVLELPPGMDKDTVLQAMEGHVIAESELMGVYSR
ncbi:MAG: YbhB/YbcL family Raf kinase inhibitor-like protein [Anaerolineales bacterium]|nr:YbhB/YbcL family Raf kinase inhibitor-like protein [Anaerolineales bacterium]